MQLIWNFQRDGGRGQTNKKQPWGRYRCFFIDDFFSSFKFFTPLHSAIFFNYYALVLHWSVVLLSAA